ncbi:hypothetical protein [Thiocapsa marina]|uniref:hypothetical protein n=1 Tax=Thiocapsa marina TaxID=244573 RepID=UPI0002F262F3|nr:hypothetical protein [Thiocapsa marina]
MEAPADLISPGMRGRIQTRVGLWRPFEITLWEPENVWAWPVAAVKATGASRRPAGSRTLSRDFRDPALGTLLRVGRTPKVPFQHVLLAGVRHGRRQPSHRAPPNAPQEEP